MAARVCCFRSSSQALVIPNGFFCTLCCCTSLLVIDPMAPYGITGNYPGCCGRLNDEAVRISYRDGHMTRRSKTLPPPPWPLWKEPVLVFILKWALWTSWYVAPPSTLVSNGIGEEDLMSIAFDMVTKTIIFLFSFGPASNVPKLTHYGVV